MVFFALHALFVTLFRADGRKYAHFEGIFETLIYLIHANIDINKSF